MPAETFGAITLVSNSYRICRNGSVFVNFSSLCALKTMDLTGDSEAQDFNYIELQQIMKNYPTSRYFRKATETLSHEKYNREGYSV